MISYHGVRLLEQEFSLLQEVMERVGRDQKYLYTITDLQTYKRWKKITEVYELPFNNPTNLETLIRDIKAGLKKLYTASKLVSKELPVKEYYVKLKDEKPERYLKIKELYKGEGKPVHIKSIDQVILYPYSSVKPKGTRSSILRLPTKDHVEQVKKQAKKLSVTETEKMMFNKTLFKLLQYAYPYVTEGDLYFSHPYDHHPLEDLIKFYRLHKDNFNKERIVKTLITQHECLNLRIMNNHQTQPVYFDTTNEHISTLWLCLRKDQEMPEEVNELKHLTDLNPGNNWKTLINLTSL